MAFSFLCFLPFKKQNLEQEAAEGAEKRKKADITDIDEKRNQ